MKTPPRFASRRRPPVEPQPYASPYPRRLLLLSLALIALLASWGTVQAMTSGKSEPTTHMPPYSPLPTGDYSFPLVPGAGSDPPGPSPAVAEPALTLSSPQPSPTTTSLQLAGAKPAGSPAVLAGVAPVVGQVSVRPQNGTAAVSVALSAPGTASQPVQPAALPTPSPVATPLPTPSQPAPTPTPTPASTPTPTPIPTPVPTATATPIPRPTPTATPQPTAKPTAASNQRGDNPR